MSEAVIEPCVRPSLLLRRSFLRFPSLLDDDDGGVPPLRICLGEESRELVLRSGDEDMRSWREERDSSNDLRPRLVDSGGEKRLRKQ